MPISGGIYDHHSLALFIQGLIDHKHLVFLEIVKNCFRSAMVFACFICGLRTGTTSDLKSLAGEDGKMLFTKVARMPHKEEQKNKTTNNQQPTNTKKQPTTNTNQPTNHPTINHPSPLFGPIGDLGPRDAQLQHIEAKFYLKWVEEWGWAKVHLGVPKSGQRTCKTL